MNFLNIQNNNYTDVDLEIAKNKYNINKKTCMFYNGYCIFKYDKDTRTLTVDMYHYINNNIFKLYEYYNIDENIGLQLLNYKLNNLHNKNSLSKL